MRLLIAVLVGGLLCGGCGKRAEEFTFQTVPSTSLPVITEGQSTLTIAGLRGPLLTCEVTDEQEVKNCQLEKGATLDDAMTVILQQMSRPKPIPKCGPQSLESNGGNFYATEKKP